MTIKETQYLKFDQVKQEGRKTHIVMISSKSKPVVLGWIKWYGPWRQYCFFPSFHSETVWNKGCLNDVQEVITGLMDQRKK